MNKIVLSALLASSLVALAEAAEVKKDESFITHTEFGFIQTDGNTKTTTYNLDAKVKKSWDKNVFEGVFDGQYASESDTETKNKFLTELTYDYEFTKRFAFDYLVGYKDDKFSGFTYQFYTGPGAKYKAIVSKEHKLTFDGNLLYARDYYDAVYVDAAGATIAYPDDTSPRFMAAESYSENYASYRAKGVYVWQILENLKFDQELSFRGSFKESDNYFAFSKSAFSSKLSDIFSAGISYKVDYINVPASGKKNTDTTLTANLIMDY